MSAVPPPPEVQDTTAASHDGATAGGVLLPPSPRRHLPMSNTQQPGPLGPKVFLFLLILFLLLPMICVGGCSIALSLWQAPPAVRAVD